MRIDLLNAFALALPIVASLLVAILAIVSLLRQLFSKQGHPQRDRRFRMFAASAALGLAFLPLAVMYRPSLVQVAKAQIRQQEEVDEDGSGDPESPLKHLLRQLRRIRRGERVDTLILRRE